MKIKLVTLMILTMIFLLPCVGNGQDATPGESDTTGCTAVADGTGATVPTGTETRTDDAGAGAVQDGVP